MGSVIDRRSSRDYSDPLTRNITHLLKEWSEGDQQALDELTPLVYEELRQQAARYLRRERPNHSLQATALINEAFLRLIDMKDVQWQNRAHFFAIAANLMRRILVDHARRRDAEKRGGSQVCLTLDEGLAWANEPDVDLLSTSQSVCRDRDHFLSGSCQLGLHYSPARQQCRRHYQPRRIPSVFARNVFG